MTNLLNTGQIENYFGIRPIVYFASLNKSVKQIPLGLCFCEIRELSSASTGSVHRTLHNNPMLTSLGNNSFLVGINEYIFKLATCLHFTQDLYTSLKETKD